MYILLDHKYIFFIDDFSTIAFLCNLIILIYTYKILY